MGRMHVGYGLAFSCLGRSKGALGVLALFVATACGGGSDSNSGAGGSAGSAGAGGAKASGGKAGTSGGRPNGGAGKGGSSLADAGEGGAPDGVGGSSFGFGGTMASGGSSFVPLGGTFGLSGGAGGRASGGAISGGTASGGANGCVEAAPCKCGTLTGVTQCTAMGSACSCPPADQCTPLDTSACFEPCGGEPFGTWVLVDSCFRGKDSNFGCERAITATPGESDVRIRILDGGEFQVAGSEKWTVDATASVECFGAKSVNTCKSEDLRIQGTLLQSFDWQRCAPNACGVCECKGALSADATLDSLQWSRQGNELTVGSRTLPYCVKGDELWLGGTRNGGDAQAAYKFKKQSCVGKPLACSARTQAQCTPETGCTTGICKAAGGGSSTRCATAYSQDACGVIQGCTWDPNGCTGEGLPECNIATCEKVPGCSWGDPVEHCGGTASECTYRNPTKDDCLGGGCSLTNCQQRYLDPVDCKSLTTAADCMKAPGCTVSSDSGGSVCTGTTHCTAQTDLNVCNKLSCDVFPACVGTTVQCTDLSLEACHDVPGCRREW